MVNSCCGKAPPQSRRLRRTLGRRHHTLQGDAPTSRRPSHRPSHPSHHRGRAIGRCFGERGPWSLELVEVERAMEEEAKALVAALCRRMSRVWTCIAN